MTEQQQPAPGGPETEIESAEAFAERYCGWDPHHTLTAMVEQRDALIRDQARAAAEQERDAARRDCERLREAGQKLHRCLFGDLAGFDNEEALAAMEWDELYTATASDPQPETGRS